MRFDDLVNEILMPQKNNLIVIFPGRFQPFHTGHKKLYDLAKKKFPGADFFVATSDIPRKGLDKDPSRYPFNFDEKKAIIIAADVPENEIVQVAQPYKPIEILKNYDSNVAKVIYILGEKDMKDDPRFSFKFKKDGTASYFQPFVDLTQMKPFKEQGGHGYIFSPGTIQFNVNGENITSATELRNLYKNSDESVRKNIITSVLGKFDKNIYSLFNKKLD
jgi:hypothetical protein